MLTAFKSKLVSVHFSVKYLAPNAFTFNDEIVYLISILYRYCIVQIGFWYYFQFISAFRETNGRVETDTSMKNSLDKINLECI